MNDIFSRFASRIAFWAGQPAIFGIAIFALMAWSIAGYHMNHSELWYRILDTATTIITFMMVFIIQNTQNRDSSAIQIKLAELLRVSDASPDALLDLEEMPIEELEKLRQQYIQRARSARNGRTAISENDTAI